MKRLTPHEKEQIFIMKAMGESQVNIARLLGVSTSCVSLIVNKNRDKIPKELPAPPPLATFSPYANWRIEPHFVVGRVVIRWPNDDFEPMLMKLPLRPGQVERAAALRAERQDPDSA